MFVCVRSTYLFTFLKGVVNSFGCYSYLVLLVFLIFISTRVPYFYGLGGFGLFLLGWIFPLFLSFFFSRFTVHGISTFFSSFVPSGTPLWISPLVVLAETVSYIVRPGVLLLRPFLNISIGFFGGAALGSLCLGLWALLPFLFILFFYEVFVAVVHWFIVCNILSFSENH